MVVHTVCIYCSAHLQPRSQLMLRFATFALGPYMVEEARGVERSST